jgi:hypothetical protein
MRHPARAPARRAGIDGKANVAAGRRRDGARASEKLTEAAA